jgi:hypothetical protein
MRMMMRATRMEPIMSPKMPAAKVCLPSREHWQEVGHRLPTRRSLASGYKMATP